MQSKSSLFKLVCYLLFCQLCVNAAFADETDFFLDKWNVSGYTKIEFAAPNSQPTSVKLDDLSLLLSANINRWFNPFLEAEVFSIPVFESGRGIQFDQAQFIIERLYNDFIILDDTTLRAGKFLAPVNHWNIVHAAPLVWATNRPITSRYSFANYITGFQIRHELDPLSGHALEFYWQPDAEFNPKPKSSQERDYQGVFGARWVFQDDLDSYYGLAVQRADVRNKEQTRTTISFDANLHFDFVELETELLLTHIDSRQKLAHNNDWGGYLQAVFPMPYKLNILTRYEYFEFANNTADHQSVLAGVVYRPDPDYSFKLEWQQTWGAPSHNPTGLFASIAVMF